MRGVLFEFETYDIVYPAVAGIRPTTVSVRFQYGTPSHDLVVELSDVERFLRDSDFRHFLFRTNKNGPSKSADPIFSLLVDTLQSEKTVERRPGRTRDAAAVTSRVSGELS